MLGLIGNQVQVGFPTMPTAFRPAQQGSLRALAVTSARRTRAMPEVPTLLEAMPDGFELDGWLALAARLLRGGVFYAGRRIPVAAHSSRLLRARSQVTAPGSPAAARGAGAPGTGEATSGSPAAWATTRAP